MAILTPEGNGNEYEVRIMRYPENTYFDEYVDPPTREKDEIASCKRHIIVEANTTYKIEVKLKKGFLFGIYTKFQVQMRLPLGGAIGWITFERPSDVKGGLKQDLTKLLEYSDARKTNVHKARFLFRDLTPSMLNLFPYQL
jgi:hypothetical protein